MCIQPRWGVYALREKAERIGWGMPVRWQITA
jgi:hypothetical protein